jgi:hypothetical protein
MFARNRRVLNAKVARAAALVSTAALVLACGLTPAVADGKATSMSTAAVEKTYVDASGVIH